MCAVQRLVICSRNRPGDALDLASSAASAKTLQELKSQHSTSPPSTHAILTMLLQVKISGTFRWVPNPSCLPCKCINKPSVAPWSNFAHHGCVKKHALSLFWGFIRLVCQTAARFLSMYIIKNTKDPPHRPHFSIFVSNFGESLSWAPTRTPPVIFTDLRGVWRGE